MAGVISGYYYSSIDDMPLSQKLPVLACESVELMGELSDCGGATAALF